MGINYVRNHPERQQDKLASCCPRYRVGQAFLTTEICRVEPPDYGAEELTSLTFSTFKHSPDVVTVCSRWLNAARLSSESLKIEEHVAIVTRQLLRFRALIPVCFRILDITRARPCQKRHTKDVNSVWEPLQSELKAVRSSSPTAGSPHLCRPSSVHKNRKRARNPPTGLEAQELGARVNQVKRRKAPA
jgi:hypothetical protein